MIRRLPSDLILRGHEAVLLSDIQYETLTQDRVAVAIIGDANEDRRHDIQLEEVIFRAAESCQSNYMLRIMRARGVTFTHCTFDCDINDWDRGALDLYGANEHIVFEDTTFRQLSASQAGGIWVRSWTDAVESRDLQFRNCDFYKAGGDEVLAVWAWCGTVSDVRITSCNFYEMEEPEYLARGYHPDWLFTLGQSGTTEVRMEGCTIHFNRCETLFHMVGDSTHAVVDNCAIVMEQPDDFPLHDADEAANPMLAQGNGSSDGSTIIQNCRIILHGDYGRRLCYGLSALRNNTFDLDLGYGHYRNHEVSGNLFQGREKYGQTCPGDAVCTNCFLCLCVGLSHHMDQGCTVLHIDLNKGSVAHRDVQLGLGTVRVDQIQVIALHSADRQFHIGGDVLERALTTQAGDGHDLFTVLQRTGVDIQAAEVGKSTVHLGQGLFPVHCTALCADGVPACGTVCILELCQQHRIVVVLIVVDIAGTGGAAQNLGRCSRWFCGKTGNGTAGQDTGGQAEHGNCFHHLFHSRKSFLPLCGTANLIFPGRCYAAGYAGTARSPLFRFRLFLSVIITFIP